MVKKQEPLRTKRERRTLAIDIGGTGIKGLVLDAKGVPVSERVRIETPRPATPTAVLHVISSLIAQQPKFDRVSVGFPGVIRDGVVKTAHNLHPSWAGVDIDKALTELSRRPTRALNDAAIQGFGAMRGRGVELTITLGTGVGSAVFVDGHVIPLEFGHHPFRNGETYEEQLADSVLKRIGKKTWKKRLCKAIAIWEATFNPRVIHLGGGNARLLLKKELPDNVHIVSNDAGMLGGIALWRVSR